MLKQNKKNPSILGRNWRKELDQQFANLPRNVEQEKIEAANNANLLPADPDAPLKMSDEARARLRIGLSALALNFAKRA